MFITHCPTVTLQLHNFDLFRTCRTSIVSALWRGNWQDFNSHDALRGPLPIAELLVLLCNCLFMSGCMYWRNKLLKIGAPKNLKYRTRLVGVEFNAPLDTIGGL